MYKFIFVDDEDLMRELFTEIMEFESYGFQLVNTFPSAEEALLFLSDKDDISLVITDIRMGTLSGLDFCEEIRKTNQLIEIVIMSGFGEFEYAQNAIKQNVFDYLLKPTTLHDLDTLFKRLKKHLDETSHTEDVETDYHYTQLIDQVKQFISENYHHDITLEDVAKHVSMNSSYLSRFFKLHTKSNFIDYLSHLRVEKAKELLQDSRIKVYEICNLVGYKNTQYFSKTFKQHTGMTPSEFRDNMR